MYIVNYLVVFILNYEPIAQPQAVIIFIIQVIIFDARNITTKPITAFINVVLPLLTFSSSHQAVNI
jgi:hypothetical protein